VRSLHGAGGRREFENFYGEGVVESQVSKGAKPGAAGRRRLHARELRQGVKMRVTGEQDQGMLQDEGCDPHIIGWDRSALLPQLPVNGGVVMGGLLVGIEDSDAGLQQKAAQDSFIAGSLAADGKSGA